MQNNQRTNHYGRPANWFSDASPAYLDALVADMKELELIFRLEFGLQLFLYYGTLLGAVRNGDFIPHDFDIDMAYVSRARSAEGILRERDRIETFLSQYGRTRPSPAKGRLVINAAPDPAHGTRFFGIEIFTCYHHHGKFFGYSSYPGTLSTRAIKPFSQATLRGVSFAAPARPQAVLQAHYGDDWQTPKQPKDYSEPSARFVCFDFLYPPSDGSGSGT